jgi:hypothetical protein
MKTGKTYIQVFVETKNDIPKEGMYFAHNKAGEILTLWGERQRSKVWLEYIDWYLLPVEENIKAKSLTDKEIENKISELVIFPYERIILRKFYKWLKSKLQNK